VNDKLTKREKKGGEERGGREDIRQDEIRKIFPIHIFIGV